MRNHSPFLLQTNNIKKMLDFKNKLRLLNNLIKLYSNELNTIHLLGQIIV